ncbi:hypothetical protein IW262DRAFT_1465944 [Armillaria fumosa]|nr:hypothetical protein IW262DRAFT_1465944 [Armillaria fumosa]
MLGIGSDTDLVTEVPNPNPTFGAYISIQTSIIASRHFPFPLLLLAFGGPKGVYNSFLGFFPIVLETSTIVFGASTYHLIAWIS